MAKKKAVSSTASKLSASTKQRSATQAGSRQSTNGKKASVNKSPAGKQTVTVTAPANQPAISHEKIGHTAGEVWRALSEKDGQSLPTLKKSVDAPADLVLTALGWLAREDKIDFAASGRSVKVLLR